MPVPPRRPLPKSLVLVAFPSAAAAAGSPTPVPLVINADAADVGLPASPPDWLQLAAPHALAPGLCRVDCVAGDNPWATRQTRLSVTVNGRPWEVEFTQQPGLLVQTEQIQVLNTPLTVDMAVLVTWVASLINDIEVPPIQLLVTVLAVLALIALGVIAALLRHLFVNVPEPRPLSTDTLGQPVVVFPGFSLPGVLPLKAFAAEDQTIALQTVKAIYWLLRQVH
ncbi:hypothetical protein [Roseateles sp.]|uniref:hypothetical protein n=1 Tax=Roseateles sp. TaxID=1971397 RepID=UPI0032671C6D